VSKRRKGGEKKSFKNMGGFEGNGESCPGSRKRKALGKKGGVSRNDR